MKLDIIASNRFRKDLKLAKELFLVRTGSHTDLF